jgi:hypothetical protein
VAFDLQWNWRPENELVSYGMQNAVVGRGQPKTGRDVSSSHFRPLLAWSMTALT